MALVTAINRQTLEVIRHAAEQKLTADWLANPSEDVIANVLRKYWVIDGDTLREMTSEEKEAVDLPLAKQSKLSQLAAWWAALEASGVEPQGVGFVLGITTTDVALLNALFTMANAAVSLGLKTPEDTFDLIDKAGQSHALNLQQLTGVLLAYGGTRAYLSGG